MIGAQIFIEPGQTDQDIDGFFRIMQENNMTVGRIRLFGAHMLKKDGTWDFTLYDKAFAAADKYGIKLFATLFPTTDELNDVGGFKFPRSKVHLNEIAQYIKAIVTHFRDKPAMYTWVLQNEPGTGARAIPANDLSGEIRRQWMAKAETYSRGDGYLKANFDEKHFVIYHTNWYLNWIATQVDLYDTKHFKHINPHQLLDNLPDYDFKSYEKYLTSLGCSMHFSWHFGYFKRNQYPLGVSVMSDIVRDGAGKNPFWITELQGGNVTASGMVPLCPTAEEIGQWLWTCIAAGSEGIIFWTLNQRASVLESGEWGLLNFQRKPSDRLLAASQVAKVVKNHSSFFKTAQPAKSNITLIYNTESLIIQGWNSANMGDWSNEGRKNSAVMKSLTAAYEAISAWGVVPNVSSMDRFDWNSPEGQTVILANMVALPAYSWNKIESFVRGGGKLIVTGLTGFYDENMRCIMMGKFPLKDCFGAEVSEFKVMDPYFDLKCDKPSVTLLTHLWKGILAPSGAEVIARDGEDAIATVNHYGEGEVVWFPSLIELGGWQKDNQAVSDFYGAYCKKEIQNAPVRFSHPVKNVLLRVMESDHQVMMVMINKQDGPVEVELEGQIPDQKQTVFGNASFSGKKVSLSREGCGVFIWNKN
ncbi:MAG: beta-galactosidase trimerization domain-containing protein [Bacteroidales bacterium]|nr:beta-galactosidase trimerization domain-containing protein [Bacteroidales bacterium]